MLPVWNRTPAFNITRASHVVLTARNLDASAHFYTEVIGLVLTERNEDTLYFRGLEEAAHHSLVIKRTDGAPQVERIGLRVMDDSDIDKAAAYLQSRGIATIEPDVAFQGRTLHFTDPVGNLMELCASMDVVDRRMQEFHTFRSGQPQRIDHYQLVTHDVQTVTDFYSDLGFRLAEYTATDGTEELWGTWLEVKGNTHDIVFTNGQGPRLHHFAYTVPDASCLIHAADVAGSLGFGDEIDRGPGRHGLSNALFLYLRDPDGHRVELFNTHYQFIDLETDPIRWDTSDRRRAQQWGMPASERWWFEATEFPGQAVQKPLLQAAPITLESYLSIH